MGIVLKRRLLYLAIYLPGQGMLSLLDEGLPVSVQIQLMYRTTSCMPPWITVIIINTFVIAM